MTERLAQLEHWLRADLGLRQFDLTPASGDASFRRYFRVRYDGCTRIVMDAPPAHEDCRPYLAVARAFHTLGLNVPEIFAQDLAQGFLLLSDLGARQYLHELNDASVDKLYGDALDALLTLQARCTEATLELPPYDHALLMREMSLFAEWFVAKHLGLALDMRQSATLHAAFELLARAALEQPRVCVHRDYHSRNLMVTERNNPGILDFQDAVFGPMTYDLVSLLRDCYIAWAPQRVHAWAAAYYERALHAGILRDVGVEHFLRWFDWMGVQRHLKAIGIFARLNIRDGKPGYLRDIPRTLGYVTAVSRRYAELAPLHDLLRDAVVPRMAALAA